MLTISETLDQEEFQREGSGMLANFLSERKSVSLNECITQSYFYFLFATTEYIFFAIMSYDLWCGSFLLILPSTILKVRLPYCGPKVIDHFFCDSAPFLFLACANVTFIELLDFIVSLVLLISSLAMTIVSYIYVIFTILKIPSGEGRQKAFSTCASHFTVVSMGYGISIFVYVRPTQKCSLHLNTIIFVLSRVVTPLLNPFIFSLRNETMRIALTEANGKTSLKVAPMVDVIPIEGHYRWFM
ncbi:olfactory receptor 6M1-like [Tachyglossus aculeatus]|uniref:olfactory receptor 6M1-like n=1 Tax=Tachyglossus aculeatus TaxID=9261 RepID=UPI0018F539CE|nr:olfactory receptor 6M1-like [Tachyglossus aculeatus]